MSLGVLRPWNKALRNNIDQNYEVLLLYYSNRSRSLVCCTFTCELRSAFMPVCSSESIFHSLQRLLHMFYNRHIFCHKNYTDEIPK